MSVFSSDGWASRALVFCLVFFAGCAAEESVGGAVLAVLLTAFAVILGIFFLLPLILALVLWKKTGKKRWLLLPLVTLLLGFALINR